MAHVRQQIDYEEQRRLRKQRDAVRLSYRDFLFWAKVYSSGIRDYKTASKLSALEGNYHRGLADLANFHLSEPYG